MKARESSDVGPMSRRELTGRVPAEAVRGAPERPARSIVERYRRITDLSSTLSDVLDGLGVQACTGSSVLRPTLPDATVIGPAVTLRNVALKATATTDDWRMAEIEGVNQSEPGDVLVIQGVHGVSNMGGIMATIARRQGLAGAVVDGGVRDVGHSRRLGFPVWSAEVTPVTGKWRVATEEVNGTVTVAGLEVSAGDLVVADETGVCCVPRALITEALERCETAADLETEHEELIASNLAVPDLTERLYASSGRQERAPA